MRKMHILEAQCYLARVAATAAEVIDLSEAEGIVLVAPDAILQQLHSALSLSLQSKEINTLPLTAESSTLVETAQKVVANPRHYEQQRLVAIALELAAVHSPSVVFGAVETIGALERCAVETILVSENLDCMRVRREGNEGIEVCYVTFAEFRSMGCKVVECSELADWLAERCCEYGASMEVLTENSHECEQLAQGLRGLAGLLRTTEKR